MVSRFPVPISIPVPPQLPLNQRRVVPEPPTAVSVMLPLALIQTLGLGLVMEVGGVGRGCTVTFSVLAVPLPQALEGVTVIFPALAPTVTVTELVVPPAVCVQPVGKAQVYVIPATLVTL